MLEEEEEGGEEQRRRQWLPHPLMAEDMVEVEGKPLVGMSQVVDMVLPTSYQEPGCKNVLNGLIFVS